MTTCVRVPVARSLLDLLGTRGHLHPVKTYTNSREKTKQVSSIVKSFARNLARAEHKSRSYPSLVLSMRPPTRLLPFGMAPAPWFGRYGALWLWLLLLLPLASPFSAGAGDPSANPPPYTGVIWCGVFCTTGPHPVPCAGSRIVLLQDKHFSFSRLGSIPPRFWEPWLCGKAFLPVRNAFSGSPSVFWAWTIEAFMLKRSSEHTHIVSRIDK